MHTKTKKIVITALFAALTCVATMIIHIPSPLHGYINLGDVIVLAAGFMLSPVCGFLAEILMVLGYLVFESFLYGFLPSLANVPANAVQGAAGILLGVPLAGIFEKANIITD